MRPVNLTLDETSSQHTPYRADPPDPVAPRFARAIGLQAAGVAVISTTNWRARAASSATLVAPLSMAPPALLVGLDDRVTLTTLLQSRRFCVNLLSATQADVEGLCEAASDQAQAHARRWREGPYEVPYLADAQANIFCELIGQVPIGQHELLMGAVFHAVATPASSPLIRFNGALWPLAAQS